MRLDFSLVTPKKDVYKLDISILFRLPKTYKEGKLTKPIVLELTRRLALVRLEFISLKHTFQLKIT